MKPLYIFRHITCEGPGYLETVLERHHIPARLIAIDQDEPLPDSLEGCSGLVFMGGPMSVNDPLPWIEQELALIRQAREIDMPVLGHCLGGQLICKALGGTVGANKIREIGWHPVNSVSSNTSDRWLEDLPATSTLFHWHGEMFSIPEGAQLLLENDNCAHQAFTVGNTLALQCHVEMTEPMVREWATLYSDELDNSVETVQSVEQMTSNLETRIMKAQQAADVLYRHWLAPLLK